MDLATRVGTLVKNLPELHDVEYKVGFNLHENTFFQRIVSKELLKKGVRVQPLDYFKALVFLDYFTGIIEDNHKVCDNLVAISKALRKDEKEAGENRGASYLNLSTVIAETGLYAKEKQDDLDVDAVKSRYNSQPAVDFDSAKKPDPYYKAMGAMVSALVQRKELLENIASRADLGAVVFTDAVLGILKDPNYQSKVNEALAKKDYLNASLIALEGLSKEVSLEDIGSFIGDDKNDTHS